MGKKAQPIYTNMIHCLKVSRLCYKFDVSGGMFFPILFKADNILNEQSCREVKHQPLFRFTGLRTWKSAIIGQFCFFLESFYHNIENFANSIIQNCPTRQTSLKSWRLKMTCFLLPLLYKIRSGWSSGDLLWQLRGGPWGFLSLPPKATQGYEPLGHYLRRPLIRRRNPKFLQRKQNWLYSGPSV